MSEEKIAIRVCPLGSGSRGNCTYIGDESSGLLIDAGLSAQETVHRLRQINADPRTLRGILVTHEHSDHIYGLESVSSHLDLPVYANGRTRESGRTFNRIETIREFETGTAFEAGGYLISPVPLQHDAVDPVAFVLEKEGRKVASLTDLGSPTDRLIGALSGCDLLVLEFNHDSEMLQNGPYPARLKDRISSGHGHLSNKQAAQLLRAVVHPGLRHLFLAHISQTSNLPHLALLAAEEALHLSNSEPTIHLTWQNFVSPVASI